MRSLKKTNYASFLYQYSGYFDTQNCFNILGYPFYWDILK